MAPLLTRSEGRVPPRRAGQTAAERKLELDQALPALRAERQRCAEEEKKEKAEAKAEAKRAKEAATAARRPAKRQRTATAAAPGEM